METFPLVAIVISLLIGIPVGIAIGALLLKLAVLIVRGQVSFGKACLIVFIVAAINFAINFLIGLGIGVAGAPKIASQFISVIVNFFIASAIYGSMVKQPGTDAGIGFPKGMLIAVILLAISVLIALAIVAVFAVFMKGAFNRM